MDLLSRRRMMRIMMRVLPVLLVALRWIWEVILELALQIFLVAAGMMAGGCYGIPTQLIEVLPLRSQDDVNGGGRSLISGLIDFLFMWGAER